MDKETRKNVYRVAHAYVKYRIGQIHLYKFKEHAGCTVSEAIERYPWLPQCYEAKDIDREWSLYLARTNV